MEVKGFFVARTKKEPVKSGFSDGFPDRIAQLIEIFTERGLHEKTGIARNTLVGFTKGTPPSLDKVEMIYAGTGVSIRWLMLGEGPMFFDAAETPDKLLSPKKLQNTLIDMATMRKMIEHYLRNVWKKGTKPEEAANAIAFMCAFEYMDINKVDSADLIKLIESLKS